MSNLPIVFPGSKAAALLWSSQSNMMQFHCSRTVGDWQMLYCVLSSCHDILVLLFFFLHGLDQAKIPSTASLKPQTEQGNIVHDQIWISEDVRVVVMKATNKQKKVCTYYYFCFLPWHKISLNREGQFRPVESPTPKLVNQPLYYIVWFLF